MKSGFTLIELSIGLLLSSIIGTALYSGFFVTNRVVESADNFISLDFRSALIENQLDKDLAGIFVPEESDVVTTSTNKKDSQEKNKTTESKKEVKPVEEKPVKPIDKIFYSMNGSGGSLNVLTFITNNPIKVYEKAANVKPKSRMVRIAYRLIPQEDNPKAFSLVRQESSEFDFNAFDLKSSKPIRGYELARDIKNITVEYNFPVQKSPPPTAKQEKPLADKQEKPKPEYKMVKTWGLEPNTEQPKIPQFIKFICEFWDNKEQREQVITFNYEIQTFIANTMPKKPKKSPALEKPKSKEEPKPKTETLPETPAIPEGQAPKIALPTSPVKLTGMI